MAGKVWLGIVLASSLLFTSCYPQLSVQQYDQLRKDLTALNVESQTLKQENAALNVESQTLKQENTALKEKHAQIRAYTDFLNRLVATQNSANIVSGKLLFDASSLIGSKEELTKMAKDLKDNDVSYYLGLATTDNGTQTVAAYNKIIEYSLKKVRLNLE